MEKEAFNIEDAARLLAQAAVGDGTIYIHGFGEMEGVTQEALKGIEPLLKAKAYDSDDYANSRRIAFLLFSRHSDDSEAIQLAQKT